MATLALCYNILKLGLSVLSTIGEMTVAVLAGMLVGRLGASITYAIFM